jgi:hypothetical protein
LAADTDLIVSIVADSADVERARSEADDLRRRAASARANAHALLAEAEQRLNDALTLERRIRDLEELVARRQPRLDTDDVREQLTRRLREAESELRRAEALASRARDRGEQALVEANESLVEAARRERTLAARELERLARPDAA